MSELKTCFKRVDYDLSNLLHYLEIGDIGLPDIQRPFVWANAKVRDLFDSMYRGFPVGYLLFWENAGDGNAKAIGLETKRHKVPARLIVDGQQRLTSLYAVFRGQQILDEDYNNRQIEIAFRPRDGKFEVADAAVRRDPEWIPNISTIWSSGHSSRKLVNDFIDKLQTKTALTSDDEEQIAHNLDKLFDLQKYPFTALEIAPTVDEEQVADIFVRINSEGVKLNQADFILTLLSVFWEDGRVELERFCRESRRPVTAGVGASPFNHFVEPDPDQLLRVAVALGFNRGRLKSIYQVLRGKDLSTGEFSAERREQQFNTLRDAQTRTVDLTHWHQFFKSLLAAGFRSGSLVSSKNALYYAYAFYLIGRTRFRVPEFDLQNAIGRWFFGSSLLRRYSSSPESVMDSDLNTLKEVAHADGYIRALDGMLSTDLTDDYWSIALPAALQTSSGRSPELFAFVAAQNRLNAPVLFSQKRVPELLDPALNPRRAALERHHLFPKAWLHRNGIKDVKETNQIANYALIEWPDNANISDQAPADYVPGIRARFDEPTWTEMCDLHALPGGWETMEYRAFLDARRKLMAAVVKRGFQALK